MACGPTIILEAQIRATANRALEPTLLNLTAAKGIDIGPADYILFVDRKPIVDRANRDGEGVRLTVIKWQSLNCAQATQKPLNNASHQLIHFGETAT